MSRLRRLKIPDKLAASVELAVFDFDGVFTDNTVYLDFEGRELVRFWRSDGIGVGLLKKSGVRVYILSTQINPIVGHRANKIGVPFVQGLESKSEELVKLAKKFKIDFKKAAYVGNDINDIECLRLVGVPIVVADAYEDAKAAAKYVTAKWGGLGAVREVCDWIVKCKKNEV